MNTSFTTSDGAVLHFDSQGEGEPIVFLHGFSLDHTMWADQVAYFSPRYQVITPDMRGYGESDVPNGKYSHGQDLQELLTHLGIHSAHVVGLSLGGEVAIDFTLTYPEMVKTLTLADSSLGGFASTVNWDVHAREVGVEKAKENWLKHSVFAHSLQNPEVAAKAKIMINHYSGWHLVNTDPREKLQPPAKERLGEIAQPVLILVGEHDLPYYFDIAACLEHGLPHSQKVVIPRAGHLVNMDNPERFNAELEKFLS